MAIAPATSARQAGGAVGNQRSMSVGMTPRADAAYSLNLCFLPQSRPWKGDRDSSLEAGTSATKADIDAVDLWIHGPTLHFTLDATQ